MCRYGMNDSHQYIYYVPVLLCGPEEGDSVVGEKVFNNDKRKCIYLLIPQHYTEIQSRTVVIQVG